jgi:hypothetical protein
MRLRCGNQKEKYKVKSNARLYWKQIKRFNLIVLLPLLLSSCFFDIFSENLNEIKIIYDFSLATPEGYGGNRVLIQRNSDDNFDVLIQENIIAVIYNYKAILIKTFAKNQFNYFKITFDKNKYGKVEKLDEAKFQRLTKTCIDCKNLKLE